MLAEGATMGRHPDGGEVTVLCHISAIQQENIPQRQGDDNLLLTATLNHDNH